MFLVLVLWLLLILWLLLFLWLLLLLSLTFLTRTFRFATHSYVALVLIAV